MEEEWYTVDYVEILSLCDCVSEIGCKSHDECASQKACINGRCADPCTFSSPCLGEQECQVIDHQPVCIKGKLRMFFLLIKFHKFPF